MKTIRTLLITAALLAIAPRAFGDTLTARADGGVTGTDNATNAPKTSATADTIYQLHGNVQAATDLTDVSASLMYDLDYYHYQKLSALDRALHTLDGRVKQTAIDPLDLELRLMLAPVPLSYSGPLDDPANEVQSSRASLLAAWQLDADSRDHFRIGYQGTRGDYFRANKHDYQPPGYWEHDPGASWVRDLPLFLELTVDYRYRVLQFDARNRPPVGDMRGNIASATIEGSPWDDLVARAQYGLQLVQFDHHGATQSRQLFDFGATLDDGEVTAKGDFFQHIESDVTGRPTELRLMQLDLAYTLPWQSWSLGGNVQGGTQHFLFADVGGASIAPRSFVEIAGRVQWQKDRYALGADFSRYQSLEDTTARPRITVDRYGIVLSVLSETRRR